MTIAFHAAIRRSGRFESYRIRHTQPAPDRELVARAWTDVLVGHWVVRPPLLWFAYPTLRRILEFEGDDGASAPLGLWRAVGHVFLIVQIGT